MTESKYLKTIEVDFGDIGEQIYFLFHAAMEDYMRRVNIDPINYTIPNMRVSFGIVHDEDHDAYYHSIGYMPWYVPPKDDEDETLPAEVTP